MPIIWTRAGLGLLVAAGMILFLAGVIAGSAVGTLLRPESDSRTGRPLLLAQENRAGERSTRLFASTSGGALWSTQNGRGTAVRGDSRLGHGGVFTTDHRNASGLRAESEADSRGSGAGVIAVGNRNPGLRASSETVGVAAAGDELALHAEGAAMISGDLTITGTCSCLTTVLAVNASEAAMTQGDVVMVMGTTRGPFGALVLQVAAAAPGSRGWGIVESAVEPTSVRIDGDTMVNPYTPVQGSVAPGAMLRVVVGGIVDFARADESGGRIQRGDSLGIGSVGGSLATVAAGGEAGASIGYALGPAVEGRVAVLIDAH